MACQKEATTTTNKEYIGVDADLWEYFERFESEGQRRGFDIDIATRGITATLEPIESENVGGLCNYHTDHQNEVVVDAEIWAIASPLQREMILFHELGHCYLLREHRDDAYDDGFCKSIMRSGIGGCTDRYVSSTRSLYLDELFDPDSVE